MRLRMRVTTENISSPNAQVYASRRELLRSCIFNLSCAARSACFTYFCAEGPGSGAELKAAVPSFASSFLHKYFKHVFFVSAQIERFKTFIVK